MECGKVIVLEKKLKAAEEMLKATEKEVASREAAIQEAKQQDVEEFK